MALLHFIRLLSHKSLLCRQNWFPKQRNMKTWFVRFNIYFSLAAVFFAAGCASNNPNHSKKEQTTMRLYMESTHADLTHVGTVLVTRDKVPFMVDKEPFLDEADITKAALVDDPSGDGTFSIQLGFNDHGSLILEMMTTSNKGRHIIIFSQFPIPGEKQPKVRKKNHNNPDDEGVAEVEAATAPPPESPDKPRRSAWLFLAVLVRDRIGNGVFRFSPDASHEEAARIVRGLKNVIAESKRADKYQL